MLWPLARLTSLPQEFMRQLAHGNGLTLQWDQVSPDKLDQILFEEPSNQSAQQIRRIMLIALDPAPQKSFGLSKEKANSREDVIELDSKNRLRPMSYPIREP